MIGFDPLGLAENPESRARFVEAELIHGRWAMMGVAGVLAVDVLGLGNWYDVQVAINSGSKATYLGAEVPWGDKNTIVGIEFIAMAFVETQRLNNTDANKKCYPGFDFAGMAKDATAFESMKIKEVKNGRL